MYSESTEFDQVKLERAIERLKSDYLAKRMSRADFYNSYEKLASQMQKSHWQLSNALYYKSRSPGN